MQSNFISVFNSFQLKRYPHSKNNSLQAWDAADSYLLEHLKDNYNLNNNSNVVIFNDSFGALTLSLIEFNNISITDSFLSKKAIEKNAELNGVDSNKLPIQYTQENSDSLYDFVLIKLPKTFDYLDDFLINLKENTDKNTVILIAGMIKNMPSSLWTRLESNFGSTKTSLTKKKAKIIELNLDGEFKNNSLQSKYPIHYLQEESQLTLYSYSNVFSKQSLDIGTRFLLQNLPELSNIKSMIDLGCGNGVIGLNFAKLNPTTRINFVDESYMAIESARLSCIKNGINIQQHQFTLNDSLNGFENNAVDLIICNPPFHQSHNLSIDSALTMFNQSFCALNKGGKFIVIANRHLPYHTHLKRIFKNCKTVASNNKFNLFMMTK